PKNVRPPADRLRRPDSNDSQRRGRWRKPSSIRSIQKRVKHRRDQCQHLESQKQGPHCHSRRGQARTCRRIQRHTFSFFRKLLCQGAKSRHTSTAKRLEAQGFSGSVEPGLACEGINIMWYRINGSSDIRRENSPSCGAAIRVKPKVRL